MFHNFKNKSSASARIMICDGSGDNVCVQRYCDGFLFMEMRELKEPIGAGNYFKKDDDPLVSEPMMIIAVNNLKSLEVIAEWIETAKTNLINSKIKEGAF